MVTFYKKLHSFLKDRRKRAKVYKEETWELQLSKEEQENIIGPIEDPTGTEQNYVYAIYPWEDRVYILTRDGWEVDLESVIQEPTIEKLYNSIINRHHIVTIRNYTELEEDILKINEQIN